jgi:hypothetical protein
VEPLDDPLDPLLPGWLPLVAPAPELGGAPEEAGGVPLEAGAVVVVGAAAAGLDEAESAPADG